MITKSKGIVKKSNALINARYTLPISAQKLIAYIASKVEEDDKDFYELEVHASELAAIGDYANPYEELKRIADAIYNAEFLTIPDGENEDDFYVRNRWVSKAAYKAGKGAIGFKFDSDVAQFLLQLNEKMSSSYKLSVAKSFNNIYSLRIYELLIQHIVEQGELTVVEFDLDTFRKILVLDDKYGVYGDLNRYVLKPVLAEIQRTDLTDLTLLPIKSGKKVVGLKYMFTSPVHEEDN